jgi:hypothetical protein
MEVEKEQLHVEDEEPGKERVFYGSRCVLAYSVNAFFD